ncbi:MAG: S41 family peptidase [Bryobacteraceae bacterium]|nr:S41 family peptidase [Bryobacteraceae bacterium]
MSSRFQYTLVTLSGVLVALLLVGVLLGQNRPAQPADPYRHLNVFTEVLAKIKSDYVEEPDMKSVSLGAINGLLVSLDPFACYLNADQYKQYLKTLENPRGGVGLILSRKYGYELGVVDAIPGSPADREGLTTGDIIEAINGILTRDMPLAFADVLLHGEPGTEVELTVLRLSRPEPVKVKLKRAVVSPPPVEARMLDAETGYVAVTDLTAGKAAQVASAVKELAGKGAKKLVLDLRHAALSVPEEGVALADLFLDKGVIATLEGQKVKKQVFEASPVKTVFRGPMVVLTNRGTAGAAEIAAAALAGNKRAEVVGERTYGDAALRKPVPTGDGGAVLLAVAKYYAPDGKAINETSVVPQHPVSDFEPQAMLDEDEAAPAPAQDLKQPEKKEDAVLKKALEILGGKAAQALAAPLAPAAAGQTLHKGA